MQPPPTPADHGSRRWLHTPPAWPRPPIGGDFGDLCPERPGRPELTGMLGQRPTSWQRRYVSAAPTDRPRHDVPRRGIDLDWDRCPRLVAPVVDMDYTSLWGGEPERTAVDDLIAGWRAMAPGFDATPAPPRADRIADRDRPRPVRHRQRPRLPPPRRRDVARRRALRRDAGPLTPADGRRSDHAARALRGRQPTTRRSRPRPGRGRRRTTRLTGAQRASSASLIQLPWKPYGHAHRQVHAGHRFGAGRRGVEDDEVGAVGRVVVDEADGPALVLAGGVVVADEHELAGVGARAEVERLAARRSRGRT